MIHKVSAHVVSDSILEHNAMDIISYDNHTIIIIKCFASTLISLMNRLNQMMRGTEEWGGRQGIIEEDRGKLLS